MAVGRSHAVVLLLFAIGSVHMQGIPPCDLPFFESSGVCVQTCPEFQIGNHLTGACEPLPDNYMVALNATQYEATAIVNASLGMPVIYFKITINNTFFQGPDVVAITVIRNDVTNRIFKLENGDNFDSILNPADGSNGVIIIERAVIYSSDPSEMTKLPVTFDFEINAVAAKTVDGTPLSGEARALGVVVVREICEPNPCENNGTCTPQGLEFSCNCAPGFDGETCDIDLPFCQEVTCLNGGNCVEGFGTETLCLCVAGFSGPLCETDVRLCSSDPCLNGASCTNEADLSFSCSCAVGYTGEFCQTDLDSCQNDTCDNGGSCREGPGSETTCDCVLGFTGAVCETDLEFCGNVTCLNGGVCVEGDGVETACNCTEGFSGLECEVDLDVFCQNDTCMNGGNCTEGIGPEVSCVCPEGFNGTFCEVDLAFCETDTCSGNGNCSEGLGTETACDCFPGYSGLSCETDIDTFCLSEPCGVGGSCNEGPGDTTTCDCFPGYSGPDCSIDLEFCTPETCLNQGTCIENIGEIVTCLCAAGFTGTNCDSDDPDYVGCSSEICLNGGTCMEEFGPATSCNCMSGFNGSVCENDLDVCELEFCENNGTCIEGVGDSFNCSCQAGYTGDACTEDDRNITFCETNNVCRNGATCLEEFGPNVSCDCAPGFSGVECEVDLDFCPSITCQNGGTCQEGLGNLTACDCSVGHAGATCEDDDQNYVGCALVTCANEGTCVELFGPNTRCMCPEGFSGATCEVLPTGGIIGLPTYVFWIIVGVVVGVVVVAFYLVVCLICVVLYKRKQKMRTYAFEEGNTSELPLAGFENVVREGVQTTRSDELNASTGSLGSNLSDSSDSNSVDAMASVHPYATVNTNRGADQNAANEISPYATLQHPDGNPSAPTPASSTTPVSATNAINPYATSHNPDNAGKQTTTAASTQKPPSSDRPPASAQKPDQPYARVRVTFTKPADRTGAPGETNPLESITEPAGPIVPERTAKMFETATPPVLRPSAGPGIAVAAGPGSSPTGLPSPQHTSTPIHTSARPDHTPARPDHSTVIANPAAVQSIGGTSSNSDSGSVRPTWSPDPTLASTSATLGSADEEDLSAYANKSVLMSIAASTGLTLTGSDGSTVVANPAVVDALDGPSPPVLAFGTEGSPIFQQPTATSNLEQSPQETQSETALQQAIQQQLEEHSEKQLQGLQESFERYTLRLEQQLTRQQKNWEEEMRRRKEEEDWARREKERVEKMMDSQRQSGSFPEFGRSTSPTSPASREPEGGVAQLRKVAAVSTGIQKDAIPGQELLTLSGAVQAPVPPRSPPGDDPRPTSSPLKDAKPTPPFLPPSPPTAVSAPPPLNESPPLTHPLPPSPQLTAPLPLKEPLPAPPPSKDTAAAPPPTKDTAAAPPPSKNTAAAPPPSKDTAAAPPPLMATIPVKRVPPPKPSRDSLDSLPAPPLQGSVPPRRPPPPPPPLPSSDTATAAPPRSSAWPPAPVPPPPPHLDSLTPPTSPQRPTIPAPTRRKPMILPPPGIRYITLKRPDLKTSFGFVVLSNTKRKGCVISRLVPDSPAHSCGELFIMDEVLAVNGQDVCSMDHAAILALIKNSGTAVKLTVQQPKIIIKRRPRGRRNLSSEFSGSGPLRRFESIQEVDEEEYEDDVIEDDDDKPLRFQRTWSLPIGNKEAEITFPSSQYVHSAIPSHVDTSQQPSPEASLHASPQVSPEQSQQATSGKVQENTQRTGQSRPVVEQYDDVHFIKHKQPKLLEAPAPVQFDESKVRFGKSHVSPNQHKKNVKHDTLTAGADSELKAALRVRRKQLSQNGMAED